ncbi:MAG: hypothetical protein HFE63_05670 [Clostridiales bacterium]|nr:hypothetical protein [Clostridiales bacterium]
MKKSIISAILILALAALASCSSDKPSNTPNTDPNQSIVSPEGSDTKPQSSDDTQPQPETSDTLPDTLPYTSTSSDTSPDTSPTTVPDDTQPSLPTTDTTAPAKTDTPDVLDDPSAITIADIRAGGTLLFENESLIFAQYDGEYYAASVKDGSLLQVNLEADKWVSIDCPSSEYLMLVDSDMNLYKAAPSSNAKAPLSSSGKLTNTGNFAGFNILSSKNGSYSIIVDGDNNILLKTTAKLEEYGDMLLCKDRNYNNITAAYNINLESISEESFYRCILLDDGRLLVAPNDTETFRVYAASGEFESESKKYSLLLDIINDLVLVIDDNQAKLVDFEENEAAVLCDWSAKTFFRSSLSKYDDGVYSVTFEDRNDGENIVKFTCSYDLETNEVTIITAE